MRASAVDVRRGAKSAHELFLERWCGTCGRACKEVDTSALRETANGTTCAGYERKEARHG